ncbi:PDR/VanB family oxidoreductase [Pseudonocardia sp. NPDC049154]|uniref:PDR/VanB family oxidoreductase n=1 Tax=Pseudonocardia sp. NPDC049154 TaxID=3155501 RepID=UPI0033C861C2
MRSTHDEVDVDLVVAGRVDAADGVIVLDLRAADGTDLPAWEPGAHVDLQLTPDLSRQYSLCGDPDRHDVWRIGVLLEPESRGGSRFVHDKLHVGAEVRARGPRNHFALEPSPRYVFVAGGIGVTPIVPMIGQAERAGAEWTLLYGGRTLSSMAFREELALLGGGRVTVTPQDTHGLLDLPALLAEPRADTLLYVCGPEPLLDAVTALTDPWPVGALHLERFTPKTLGPVEAESFEVELVQSGLTLTVPPDRSILDVVTEAGVDAPSSCGEGTCGTCETVVVEGTPEHRDSLLTPEEQAANDTMMICVSRAACPRLVLDI